MDLQKLREEMTLEEQLIEIYEQVAGMAITPNEARKQFLALYKQEYLKLLERVDGELIEDDDVCNCVTEGDVDAPCDFERFKIRNELRDEQRLKLAELKKELEGGEQ